jgi:hypothetical protein
MPGHGGVEMRSPKQEYSWAVYKNLVKDGGPIGRQALGTVEAPNEEIAIQRAFLKFNIWRFDDRARIRAERKDL